MSRKSYLSGIVRLCSSSSSPNSRGFCTDTLQVVHNKKNKVFAIKFEPGKPEAGLFYNEKNGVLDMYHTIVPPELQGKGIAKKLAQAAFDYTVENNLKMRLTCTYLQKYYNDNPKDEYKKVVVP